MDKREKIRQLSEEIEELEQKELSWSNCEKLAMLYTVRNHMCKELEENGEEESEAIGFHTNSKSNMRGNQSTNREIREIVNDMNENELRELVNRHAQDLQERGNSGSYQRLYDRARRYRRR